MATIILSTIGGLFGGPIGRAVGAVAGNAIDGALFAPKAREGPRIGNLTVQTSQYGAPIPKLFGAVRVAGSVIWATDLRETRSIQSNGKGKPKTNVYSYSASFAVSLSARPIIRVGRIWADGNLLRGDAGDFKTQTGFRLHTGTEGQAVDPLIAAAEGLGATPTYRGLAYAVFEDFQLGDYGNRIPSLSFEVFADEGAVSIGNVIAALAGEGLTGAAPTMIGGFAALGDSVRGVAEVLASAVPLSLVDDSVSLIVREAGPAAVPIPVAALGAQAGGKRSAKLPVERRSVQSVPETLSIAYYDAARDYQPGLQSARRDGGARRGGHVDLPATLSASAAKALAEARLTGLWAERVRATVRVPFRYLALRPGDRVTLPGKPQAWRIASTTLEAMVVVLDLVPVSGTAALVTADGGRPVSQADAIHGPTTISLIDLPPLGDVAPTQVNLAVAAAGVSPGWRRAALLTSINGGASFENAGVTAAPAVLGSAVTILGSASAALMDRVHMVDVQLLSAAMLLADADDMRLIGGANLAMLGNEMIQFGRAQPLGAGKWRLSVLLRGRRGTEAAVSVHSAGEPFVLIDTETLTLLDAAVAQDGVQVMAVGIDDGAVPPIAAAGQVGAALRPLSPVHPRVTQSGGDTVINWIRRSREGWRWNDGIDVPIAEERELYRATITPGAGAARTIDVEMPSYTYSAADRAADVAGGASGVSLSIRQIGARGISVPLTTSLTF